VVKRDPATFVRWDHDDDGRDDNLAVLNLLSTVDEGFNGYEVLLFALSEEGPFNSRQIFVGEAGRPYRDDALLKIIDAEGTSQIYIPQKTITYITI